MSISSISGPPPFPPPGSQNPMQQNLQALSQAIQSGDLSAAQQAFATLTQNQPQNAGSSTSSSPFQQALQSIGTALNSGDISGAQSALQSLQKGHHGGHHHRAQATDSSIAAAGPSTDTTSTASSLLDITA